MRRLRFFLLRGREAFSKERINLDLHYAFSWVRNKLMNNDRSRIFFIQKIVCWIVVCKFLSFKCINPNDLFCTWVVLHEHGFCKWIIWLKLWNLRVEKCVSDDQLLIFEMRSWSHLSPWIWMNSNGIDQLFLQMIKLPNKSSSDLKIRSSRT